MTSNWYASLPWYDIPEARTATDALWQLVAKHLEQQGFEGIPQTLNRETPFREQWNSSQLLFSQSCGYDVVVTHRGRLQVLATPMYDVPGCSFGTYRSRIVVHKDTEFDSLESLRGTRCVINETKSHSGRNALNTVIAPMSRDGRFFSEVLTSGGHENSLTVLMEKRADVAAIDCVTYHLLEHYRPEALSQVRALETTEEAIAPPFVCSAELGEETIGRVRSAFFAAIHDPESESIRQSLFLKSIEEFPLETYESIAEVEKAAVSHGYLELIPTHS